MRIVGGKYKSRTLVEFGGFDVRPTSDKVRESFFNIIQNRIYGAKFLDVFCGTGAMGIEAISRGASFVHFNDNSRESLKILNQNLTKLKVDEDFKQTNSDALVLLKNLTEKFDIIYVDPPYKKDMGQEVVSNCLGRLNEDGIVVLEDEKPFGGQVEGLVQFDQRKYGRAYLTFFREEK